MKGYTFHRILKTIRMDNNIMKNQQGVTVYIISERHLYPKVLHLNLTEEEIIEYFQKMPIEDTVNGNAPFNNGHLFIWDKCGFKKVAIEDILFLEASRSYCQIHLAGEKSILVSVPMAETLKYLPEYDFTRIHRGYVVNLKYIEALSGNIITMENGSKLPVGREYRSNVYKSFTFVGTKNRKYTE